ncbi:hypothetical protein [Duncaniella muris]|jgi:hypothetical protein|uniref:hypothetical protein n=1 Tax=Duncaniella muris TaxID=2094150 RepID=UPI00272BB017|nr:hypothetical protein [Duncaniella muris]
MPDKRKKDLRDSINQFRAGSLTYPGMSFDEICAVYRKIYSQKNVKRTKTQTQS